jgi:hypothetical protein
VRVRWQAVPSAVVYSVSRRHGGGSETVLTPEQSTVEFIDADAPLGEVVYFVTARDAAGNRSQRSSCAVVMGAVP